MIAFILRRLLSLGLTLAGAALAVFLLLEVVPGDPASILLGVEARPDTLAALRAELGLDRPAWLRFLSWIGGMGQGDFGISYTYRVPVAELLVERLAITLPLAGLAIAISTALALPLGVAAAARHNRAADWTIQVFSQIGVALPNFWLGLLLILGLALELGWFPAGSFPGWSGGIWPALHALLLPALALALPQAAILTRITRAAVLETLGEDYIRTARAKGLSQWAALWRHGVRNALIPVLTILGLQFSFLVAGAILVENVFSLPGLGRLLFQAMSQRDLIVVKTGALAMAALVMLVNFLVDLAYGLIDPRLRDDGGIPPIGGSKTGGQS